MHIQLEKMSYFWVQRRFGADNLWVLASQLWLNSFPEYIFKLFAKYIKCFFPAGRDPRAMDTRGPVTAQRVPMAAGMPGAIPHGMGPNAPPPARPVKQHQMLVSAAHCAAFVVAAFSFPVL